MLKNSVLAVVMALLAATTFATEDPKAIPETELAAQEVISPTKAIPLPWSYAIDRFPFLAYWEAFEQNRQTENQNSAGGLPGTTNNISRAATLAGTVSTAGAASPFGTAPLNWTALAIGVDILSALSSELSHGQIRQKSLATFQRPSMFLLRHVEADNDADIYARLVEAQDFVMSLGISCVPARWRADNKNGSGEQGIVRVRPFVCGFGPDDSLPWFGAANELKNLIVFRTKERGAVALFDFRELDKMSHLGKILGLKDGDANRIAEVAFEAIKHRLPKEWSAIYTVPTEDGKWSVVAAGNRVTAKFPPIKN